MGEIRVNLAKCSKVCLQECTSLWQCGIARLSIHVLVIHILLCKEGFATLDLSRALSEENKCKVSKQNNTMNLVLCCNFIAILVVWQT